MEACENPGDAHFIYKMLAMSREWYSPNQAHVFCKLVKEKLFKYQSYCNPYKKISKAQHSNMMRSITIKADVSNTEQCAEHDPRKQAHGLLVHGQFSLCALCNFLHICD